VSTPTPTPTPSATPTTTPPPGAVERAPGDVPTSIEEPPPAEPPPGDVSAPPPPTEPVAPPPEPTPPPVAETVTPAPAPATDGNLLVKDEAQANALRKKGIAVMVAGGVITVAGLATSVAFTIRGRQFESLLLTAEEDYNVRNCAYKNVKEGDPCDQLAGRVNGHNERIDFADRATKAAGAAMAAGVLVTVAGGIIYRLGIKKLKSGDIASRRFQMQPAIGRSYGGFVLQGRF
jgi:hypothetical protein